VTLELAGEYREVYRTLAERPHVKLGCVSGLRAEGGVRTSAGVQGPFPDFACWAETIEKEERKREKGKVLKFLKRLKQKNSNKRI
jgi:hypothetical protein